MIRKEMVRTLEFDRILQEIARYCHSGASRDAVLDILPLPEEDAIAGRFGLVEEIRALTSRGIALRISPFEDVLPVLEKLRPVGAVLAPLELVGFIPLLSTLAAIATQLAYRTDIPRLRELAGSVSGFPDILDPLVRSLDSEGNILDTASRLLFDLRTRKRTLTARIRKRLEEIVRERDITVFLQDDFVTQRGGRWVIPVRMDSKGQVPGVVHDVSNSGETAFMEPLEIIGLANELENLTAEEKVEEIRILREICSWIREDSDQIAEQLAILIHLDLLNSIASFADSLEAEVPRIAVGLALRLVQARHPILLLLQREGNLTRTVPLDLSLGDEDSVMIITGPNAGGKTIALKTTGLLFLMALSGIPVPAHGSSSFPFITSLLVDIGDEQSIQSSLSTFSAHVANISSILGQAGKNSLILLDELGTGTEPVQGAALACAVLQELQEKGALVLATTHLTDIVGFVHRREGMVNASMEFDRETFTPLYRLKRGEPGQSHALEIARKYGLPGSVIERAHGMIGRMESEFHSLLDDLKAQRRKYEETLSDLERRVREVTEQEALLESRRAGWDRERRESLEKAYRNSKDIVAGVKRELNVILEEAKRERSRTAMKKLVVVEEQVETKLREFDPASGLSIDQVREGDAVFVRTIGFDAVVQKVDVKTGRIRVQAAGKELEVPVTDLGKRTGAAPQAAKKSRRKDTKGKEAEREETPLQLHLIGLRVEDALTKLEPFLNHASLDGIGEVRIVHGKGTGALMRGVREYLAGHPLVASFRDGEPFEGGAGATVVKIK
ncbi:MAG: endonuclease MutS2 [Deltaproteobacteria bacterium]|nr:endonuclease MutS2 [Deltaproteobacteria bacterium]